ncbi:hypothetical protein FVP43_06830 [Lactococcus sp. dk322]|nr:hypothetical protein FVP42_06860 [Lactococcus sp. dk310]TXK49808.1 hypothetical protein FVP43_06830 [Lactococcus sp. dk322]
MYNLVKNMLPFLEKYSGYISLILFVVWIIQMKSKHYILYLEIKAKRKHEKNEIGLMNYNNNNPNYQMQLSSGWYKLYVSYLNSRYNTLFLSLTFAYISFNTKSYYESSSDNFYKLLGISTTLFLAGLSYIQRNTTQK